MLRPQGALVRFPLGNEGEASWNCDRQHAASAAPWEPGLSRWRRIAAAARRDVDDVDGMDPAGERFGAGRLDGGPARVAPILGLRN